MAKKIMKYDFVFASFRIIFNKSGKDCGKETKLIDISTSEVIKQVFY